MKLATLKQIGAVAIVDGKSIPLINLGFDGSLMHLIQSGDKALDKIKEALGDADEGTSVKPENIDAPLLLLLKLWLSG
ncbi:MAG: hypothetical protein U5K69_06470 [Balneolaceae bacterium]|nr:hypothetical protein [Balneolaceae bacterium]